jgi:NAD(P)H-hydrate epimerase
MAGAVFLAGRGAILSGAGLVDLVVPSRIVDIISRKVTSIMIKMLPSDDTGSISILASEEIIGAISDSTVIAAGPGIRTHEGSRALIRKMILETDKPLILDADGLNCLALEGTDLLVQRKGLTVLTPHPGEMARLINTSAAEVQTKRVDTAVSFARKYSLIVVLKGSETVVTDGASFYINPTGNPGMAVGGIGDVLTGMIAGLCASTELDTYSAACAACWIHGTAGDLAAGKKGQISMTAEDILDCIPDAFLDYIGI